ncbi:unnamed protein product, partial [Symbiodinium sp. KB8]
YVYEHLGFLSATFAVRGSKWNKNLNESEALVQLRECLDPSEDASDIHETDWRSVKFEVDAEAASGVKSSLVVSKETDESMDVSMLEGEQ